MTWQDQARELLAAGMSINNIVRTIGKSEYAIRIHLNITGAGDRIRAREAAKRLASSRGARSRIEKLNAERGCVPVSRAITLPAINLPPVLPDEPAAPARLAPRAAFQPEHPRVALIREIHHRMIRTGKLPSRDLISELRQ